MIPEKKLFMVIDPLRNKNIKDDISKSVTENFYLSAGFIKQMLC